MLPCLHVLGLCTIVHIGSGAALQEIQLNSTLIQGKYALPGQPVTFTCESRGAEGMEWFSEEYIGPGNDFIEIFSGDDGSNQTRLGGMTVATRVGVYSDSGIVVIVSQLHITASEQLPMSSVTCRINSRGPAKTINITDIRAIQLNSTLIQEKYAFPGQPVTFTCESRGVEVIEWSSKEYIGAGNDLIEIFSGDDGSNQTRLGGMTVATRVGVYSDNGIIVIVSQLHITASEQFPMSSVTCRINGRGPAETINFNTTESIPTTTTTDPKMIVSVHVPRITTVMEASESRNDNDGCNCTTAIAVSIVTVVVTIMVIGALLFMIYKRLKSRRNDSNESGEGSETDGPTQAWITDETKPSEGTNAVAAGLITGKGGHGPTISNRHNDPSGLRTLLNMGQVQVLEEEKQQLECTVKDLKQQINQLKNEKEQEQEKVKELEANLEKLKKELQERDRLLAEEKQKQTQNKYEKGN